MMRLFGTDGIRGRVNRPPMTVDVISSVGKAAANVMGQRLGVRPVFLIGKDTRLSGYAFEYAIASGLLAGGGDVLLTGTMPTPGIAFLTISMRVHAGIVISASHNPYHDNGIKFFNRNGYKLSDELEGQIEQLVLSGEIRLFANDPVNMGKARRVGDAQGRYIEFLKSTFPRELSLDGIKIVLDCANGATYSIAPLVFSELGADVKAFNINPDGININAGCGATTPEFIARKTVEEGADAGIAFDGDGDRVIVVDEKGEILDGDCLLAILASHMLRRGLLKGKTVVATVMSNMGLEKYLESLGLTLTRTKVGDRYVVEEMLRTGANLGGEQSGHIVLHDFTTTGDGILTALQILNILLRENKPLSQVKESFERFPQFSGSIRVKEKIPLEQIGGYRELLDSQQQELNGRGRILVRYSGTEPLLRVMVEAQDEQLGRKVFERLMDYFRGVLEAG